jgi:hypothetical protein
MPQRAVDCQQIPPLQILLVLALHAVRASVTVIPPHQHNVVVSEMALDTKDAGKSLS